MTLVLTHASISTGMPPAHCRSQGSGRVLNCLGFTDVMPVARVVGACLAFACMAIACTSAAQARPKSDEQCLGQAEVRELVSQKIVLAPAPILKKARAAGGSGAKVLRALLCRRDGQYIYRISLLRRDGRVVHQAVSARAIRTDAPR